MTKRLHLAQRGWAVVLLTPGALTACTAPGGPGETQVVVQAIAVQRPTPGSAPVIHYQIENTGPSAVYILACGEQLVAELEQRGPSRVEWAPAEAAIRCPANQLYLPVVVGAAESGEGLISVPGRGTYRLRVPYRIGEQDGQAEAAMSAVIEVETP